MHFSEQQTLACMLIAEMQRDILLNNKNGRMTWEATSVAVSIQFFLLDREIHFIV